ncbi:hypothetical protein VaNZ11_008816 [Volvox africanus]|uniref:PhoD-like phosphatase metallophosphatase domain-containing protein n=1 Tax=Volvox africanus TaxID=51714 RepID=A0ABQ5S8E7_9CHLO|nr:hypothetical protein VaNZ11_008816 [Volvox africanus]
MAYLDTSPVSCDLNDTQSLTGWCNCTADYMSMPGQCMAGNIDAARERWVHAIHQPDYRAFLDFMCPPMHGAASASTVSVSGSMGFGAEPGRFPPTGTDPAICPRPIFGVYDDHDFGWNNGNRRLPNKAEFKRMFLDAVGEAPGSTRRRADAGLQAMYTLNGGSPGRDIDVVLLDERWYRDTLPCQMRQGWCQTILQSTSGSTHPMWGWCHDFLLDDRLTGRGSCCTKDQDLAAWCAMSSSAADPLWRAACDPTSREWGTVPLVLGADNATLRLLDEDLWSSDQFAVLWPRVLQASDSPMCEVLGAAQRAWLSDHLASSLAPLTLVVSGSVPVGSIGFTNPETGVCSGDDWNCWQPAQLNFLHTLANASSGCVVVITGDYHYADIKAVAPGKNTSYAPQLKTDKIKKHIYQVMSSGMTSSTAHHEGLSCESTYREDLMGLRPLGKCALTSKPNFGMVEVDWEGGLVHLTIRDSAGGGIATTQGSAGVAQHVAFSLRTCEPVAA